MITPDMKLQEYSPLIITSYIAKFRIIKSAVHLSFRWILVVSLFWGELKAHVRMLMMLAGEVTGLLWLWPTITPWINCHTYPARYQPIVSSGCSTRKTRQWVNCGCGHPTWFVGLFRCDCTSRSCPVRSCQRAEQLILMFVTGNQNIRIWQAVGLVLLDTIQHNTCLGSFPTGEETAMNLYQTSQQHGLIKGEED